MNEGLSKGDVVVDLLENESGVQVDNSGDFILKVELENYHNISLTTHASKILGTIIYRKIDQAVETSLG